MVFYAAIVQLQSIEVYSIDYIHASDPANFFVVVAVSFFSAACVCVRTLEMNPYAVATNIKSAEV